MKAPIIINESLTPFEPGCVYVFSSTLLAERYFEAWYSNESYYACDVDGTPLEILPDRESGSVWLVERYDESIRPDLAASFLRSYISSLPPKGLQKLGKSNTWLASATMEEMVEVSLLYPTE